MTQTFHSGATAEWPASSQSQYVFNLAAQAGVNTIATHFYGSTDPSSGASPSWGASEVGRVWLDGTNTAYPAHKVWQQLTASGPTYGWRTMRLQKIKRFEPDDLTLSPSSPASADVSWTGLDLATPLNSLQDSGQVEGQVAAVQLRIRVQAGASETFGADDAVFELTHTGWSEVLKFYAPPVASRWGEYLVWVPLTGEAIRWRVRVGGGTPSFAYAMAICALAEEL